MGTKLVSRTVEEISQNTQSDGMGVQAFRCSGDNFSGPSSI